MKFLLFIAIHLTLTNCKNRPESSSEPLAAATGAQLPPAGSLRVLAFGDSGTNGLKDKKYQQLEVASAMKKICKLERCDFALLLGDNFYPNGIVQPKFYAKYQPKFLLPLAPTLQYEQQFEAPYGPLGIDFYAVLGNHDYGNRRYRNGDKGVDGSSQLNYHHPRWKMPSKYFKFEKNNVLFIGIDTESIAEDATQISFLENALKNAGNKIKVVFGHDPILTYNSHFKDSSNNFINRKIFDVTKFKATLQKILSDHKVDLLVSGHDHDMQFSTLPNGTKQVVSGAAAKLRTDFVCKSLPDKACPGAKYQSGKGEYGFTVLEFSTTEFVVDFYSVAKDSLTKLFVTKKAKRFTCEKLGNQSKNCRVQSF